MSRRDRWDYRNRWESYEPSQPLPAPGGIKAQSRRGAFGQNWWSRRWMAALESLNMGARLDRGRRYARQGQVLDLEVTPGLVTARVQGSRRRPYRVTLEMHPFSAAAQQQLAAALSAHPVFAAKLLAGEMPPEMEQVLATAGLSLFPVHETDLETECSCPDWANPCKHIAAVYYLLGEEFDRDPFLIFRLRGLDREAIVALASGRPGGEASAAAHPGAKSGANPETNSAASPEPIPGTGPEPLPAEVRAFWDGGEWQPGPDPAAAEVPALTAALPRQLGNFPFWRGEEPLPSALTPIYQMASRLGMALLLAAAGEQADKDAGGENPSRP